MGKEFGSIWPGLGVMGVLYKFKIVQGILKQN